MQDHFKFTNGQIQWVRGGAYDPGVACKRSLTDSTFSGQPFGMAGEHRMMKCWRILALVLVALSLGACASSTQNQSDAGRQVPLQEIQAMHATAQAAYNRDDLRLAQTTYEKIVAQADADPETWYMLGNVYARNAEHEKAVWAYRNSLRMNPKDARVWNNISVILLKEAWEAASNAKKIAAREEPAYANSTAIVDVLSGLSFLGSKLPPPNPKPVSLSGASSVSSAPSQPTLVPQPQPVLQQVEGPPVQLTAMPRAQLTAFVPVTVLSSEPESRSNAKLTEIKAEPLVNMAPEKTAEGVMPTMKSDAPKPVPTVRLDTPSKDAPADGFKNRLRSPVTRVIGSSTSVKPSVINVKATERLHIVSKSPNGGTDNDVVLLKGAAMRVPVSPEAVYRFLSKEAPIVTYQGKEISKETLSTTWVQFVSVVQP